MTMYRTMPRLIIAGDFNDWTGQAEKLFAKHLHLKEAYRNFTSSSR